MQLKWSRMLAFGLAVVLLFGAILARIFDMQVNGASLYAAQAEEKSTTRITLTGSRGTIYDANMIPLAYNRKSYNVQFYRDPSKTSSADRTAYTAAIIETIRIVESNGKSVIDEFWLKKDETNTWKFNTGASTEKAITERISQWRQNFMLTPASRYPVEKCFDVLCVNYGIPDSLSEEEKLKVLAIWQAQRMSNYLGQPVTIAYDVDYATVCEIEVRAMDLLGISVSESSERVYPMGSLAAHTIGYVSKITDAQTMAEYTEKGYLNDALIGVSGIEASLEDQLTPYIAYRQGTKVVERNRNGKIIRELSYEAPVDGNSVVLTLDSRLQAVAEEALAETIEKIQGVQQELIATERWQRNNETTLKEYALQEKEIALAQTGAVVALDPNDGRVLAMVSYPSYDLSLFTGEMDMGAWQDLLTDSRNPMNNRAIRARDTPGSVFKLVTALGSLMEGTTTLEREISDGGYFTGPDGRLDTSHQPRCWIALDKVWQHANLNIVSAISKSCNFFFYTIGYELGVDRINKWAAQLGLTSRTGIELNNETTSFVGSQDKMYDASRAINNQYTDKPLFAYNQIIKVFKRIGEDRGIVYDEDRMDRAAKKILDIAASSLVKDDWTSAIYEVLETEMNLPTAYIQSHLLGNEFFYLINDLRWTASETIMLAIGQSITQITPIAMARYVAAIANGGMVYNAQVVDKIISASGEVLLDKQPVVANKIEGAQAYFQAIQEGMRDVTSVENDGTAAEWFKDCKYPVAAKTGTSQRTDLDVENNAWLIAYAPYGDPKIAVAIYIQNGYAGAQAGKCARTIIESYLDSLQEKESVATINENSLSD